MKVLKINPNRPEEKLLKLASHILKNDGLVVYPTDTLYGLGANALSKEAIKKVYKVKGRDFKNPLSISFYSIDHAKKYVHFNSTAMKLAKKFLPGPLTIVLPMKFNFPSQLTHGSGKVGIRIPDNKIILDLIKIAGFPITSTSANISGAIECSTAEQAANQIGKKVGLILDGGRCKIKKPSTVVEILDEKIIVLREGAIKTKTILKVGP
ncbi:MAG: threonylcarbamoyl-AMP synthase [Candidatus Aenigmarchaeota archaeon]|nr:threonylcarbamoyl-AMP synthase [Candidatus Aenigmarchaeota archaeon]